MVSKLDRKRPTGRPAGKREGFSIIELLTVMVVIGVLGALLVPAISGGRQSALRSKTKAQFAGYATAYYAYRSEYGFFPSMGESGPVFKLAGNNRVFIETLTGQGVDGGIIADADARTLNPRQVSFYAFSTGEFGEPDSEVEGEIVDAFGNPNIVIVIDRDGDGIIRRSDFEGIPDALLDESLGEQEFRGAVAIYSVENREMDHPWVFNW